LSDLGGSVAAAASIVFRAITDPSPCRAACAHRTPRCWGTAIV